MLIHGIIFLISHIFWLNLKYYEFFLIRWLWSDNNFDICLAPYILICTSNRFFLVRTCTWSRLDLDINFKFDQMSKLSSDNNHQISNSAQFIAYMMYIKRHRFCIQHNGSIIQINKLLMYIHILIKVRRIRLYFLSTFLACCNYWWRLVSLGTQQQSCISTPTHKSQTGKILYGFTF